MLYSPLDARDNIILLLVLLRFLCTVWMIYTIFTMFRDKTKILREAVQRPAPGQGNPDWHGMGDFSPPMNWELTPEQLQDAVDMINYAKGKCCDISREAKIYAMCWVLAAIY